MTSIRDKPSITILTISELASNATLLHELIEVINVAYKGQDFDCDDLRYQHDREMVEEMDGDDLCAVMTSDARVIATATFKRWRPEAGSPVDTALKVGLAHVTEECRKMADSRD